MNEIIISEAQDYLTVRKDENDYRKIVDIRNLMRKHNIVEVVGFLREYLRDKEKALRNMILIDKTNKRIDQYAGAIFRIMMAIKVLEGEEVNLINEGSEQGTEESRVIQKRNSGGHIGRRFRKDKNHDGADRIPGYAAQRHA